MIKFDGWFRRRTLRVPKLTFGVNRYYFRRLKICQWSDKAVWNDSFSFNFVGLTITNIIDLSIWRLHFKQLYMYHVHNDPIFTNRFHCKRNFALWKFRPCGISRVRVIAMVQFRGCQHRRTGYFLPGGAVNHLPKTFLQVAQIFTKQSKGN